MIWKKATVDEARSLDILALQRMGLFDQGQGLIWTLSWKSGEEVTSRINCFLEGSLSGPSNLRLSYVITDREDGQAKYDYCVRLDLTPCHLGGARWWFICPLAVEGRACRRRCRILYLPPGAVYFGCRECHQLSYESRQKHRDPFYEGFARPLIVLERMEKRLARPHSPDAVLRAMQRIEAAQETIRRSNQAFIAKARKGGLKK